MDEQSRNYLPTKLENEFDEFYRATLLQDFRFLEPQRKKYLQQFFIMLALFGFGFFFVGWLLFVVQLVHRSPRAFFGGGGRLFFFAGHP